MVHFNNNNKIFFIVSLIFGIFLFSGCWKKVADPELMVINVLDKEYFDDCHIKGSIHIPFEEITKKLNSLDKTKQYVFYCSDYACSSSTYIAKMFLDAGFKNVWDYVDGMSGWFQAHLPCEGACKKSYLESESMRFEDESEDLPVITTEELYNKMKEFNLL
jgi:rhodanese-related sulfurtransferase